MIVPILVSREQLEMVQLDQLSLCYEVHGREDTWFNLVSDQCTSVNAHYNALTDELNAIDEIAIRAVNKDGLCRNITVQSNENCQVTVDGVELKTFNDGGIRIRSYSNRVRISVPNCNRVVLVMWAECRGRGHWASGSGSGGSRGGSTGGGGGDEELMNESVKFVVMRGLNRGHRVAHGLLGRQCSKT